MPRLALVFGALLLISGCKQLHNLVDGDQSPTERGHALLQKAQASEQAGDDASAISQYEAARALLSTDPVSAAALGRLYAKQGNDASAIFSLKRAIELSGDPASRKLLAELYLRKGQAELAAQILKAGATADGDDLDGQLKLAQSLILAGKAEDAIAVADRMLAAHPANAAAYSAKAEALLAEGDADGAAKLLDAAVAANPTSVDVRLARARFLSQRNLHEKALAELERIDPSQAGRSDVVQAQARELALLHRYDDAAKVLDAFAAQHPNDLEGQGTLAWVKLEGGDLDGARAAAEAVLARRPNDGASLYVRARCLESSGTAIDATIGAYQSALAAVPGQVESLERLWRLYERAGKVTDAVTSLETLYQLGSALPEEKFELARLYAETGLNSQRGLKLVEALSSESPPPAGLAEIRKKLQVNAGKDHSHAGLGGNGGGIQGILRGGH